MMRLLEIVGPDGRRQVRIVDRVVLGREEGDVILADVAVSRRHLMLDATGPDIVATDLNSSNGTFLDGRRLSAPAVLAPGSELRAGDTIIRVLDTSTLAPSDARQPHRAPTSDPGLDGQRPERSIRTAAVDVRFVPGTYGAQLARRFAVAAGRARRHLEGLGSEAWGAVPVLHLVDPYVQGGEVIASGTVLDLHQGCAWLVVTPESPPEDPHRVLALLFGSVLPAAAELWGLLEGYGLHRAELEDPAEALRHDELPSLSDATGERRAAMWLSFVRFLIGRADEQRFRQLLAAPAGALDRVATELFGAPLAELEAAWRASLEDTGGPASTRQFLKLSAEYLRPYRAKQAEIFVYMLLSLAFVAALPLVTKRLFDVAIPSGRMAEVYQLLAVLAVAFVVSLGAAVLQAYKTAWVAGAVTRDLRRSLFGKVQRLPMPWYGTHAQGDVLARLFNDVDQVENGLSEAIGQGVFQTLSLLVSATIMLTIDLRLSALVLLSAPLVAVVYRRMASQAQARALAVQEHTGALLSIAAENYRAIPVVKLFGLAQREERRFADGTEAVFKASRLLSLWKGYFGLSVNLIVTVLRLAILGLGALLILHGHLSVGGLVAFISVMGDVLAPVTVLVTLSQDVQAALGSLVRLNEIIDAPPEPERADLPALAPMRGSLDLRAVSLAYTADRRAIDELSVSIRAGSRVAFVGPSGSGKSSVLRLLMRLYDPDEGSITVDGVDLRSCSLASWRDQIAVVFQDSFLFDASVWDNIAVGRPDAGADAILAAARSAEVDTFIPALADGWNTVVGEAGGNLSGGQRQRVAIARALLRNPTILLFDEATSALDPATERQINETIERIAVGRTIVAVTHRLASVRRFDQICVVVDGHLAEQGTHEELLARAGVYAQLWAEQTGTAPAAPPPFDLLAALRRVPFLASATEAQLSALASQAEPVVLDAGGEMNDAGGLAVLVDGQADVIVADPAGRPTVVAALGAGDAFGVASSLGKASASTLRANTTVRLLFLAHEHLEPIGAAASLTAEPDRGVLLPRLTLGGLRHAEFGSSADRPPPPPPPPPPPTTSGAPRRSGVYRRAT